MISTSQLKSLPKGSKQTTAEERKIKYKRNLATLLKKILFSLFLLILRNLVPENEAENVINF